MTRARNIEALIALLTDRVAMPHEWGANDCIAFAAAVVKAQTGRSSLGRHRWRSQAGAIRALRDAAAEALGKPREAIALERCIKAVLDARFKRIAPAQAMRGDIAGVPPELAGADPALGLHPMIVEGLTLCAPGPDGLVRVPRQAMAIAWSVTDAPAKKRRSK